MALHGGLSFCKTQQVVGFDCAGIEPLSVPQRLLLGEPICIVFLQRSLRLVVDRQIASYRNSSLPRSAVQQLETHIALERWLESRTSLLSSAMAMGF